MKSVKGSVKDLQILKEPKEKEMGIGRFIFSNRYSVFDWGEMPDHIPYKGAALCMIGAYFFERAEELGIKTHYHGIVRQDGKLVHLNDIDEATNIMEIDLVRVIHPMFNRSGYDYSMFNKKLENFLIPLEIIYRNGLPEGSSIFKRLKEGSISYQDLELDHYPKPGEKLDKPIFDLSTKLEEEDRYIIWKEAQEISGLVDKEVEEIKQVLLAINNLISEIAENANLNNEDGKIELAYDSERRLTLVDVIGTLDECRFTCNGLDISKEAARQFYKPTSWYKDVLASKKLAKEQGIKEWKPLCPSNPENLDSEFKRIFSNMYTSVANEFIGKAIFKSPKLETVVNNYGDWIERR